MKYTKLTVRQAKFGVIRSDIDRECSMEKWLTKNFGKPGVGQRWFSRSYTKIVYQPRDRRRRATYGREVCFYFRDPKDLTLFSLMYNG